MTKSREDTKEKKQFLAKNLRRVAHENFLQFRWLRAARDAFKNVN